MKILYLTPPHIDYLSDQIYAGLCKVLGWESVVDFPHKPYYHDPSSKVPSLPQNAGRRYDLNEVVTLLEQHEFDLVVLSAIRRGALEALEAISQRVPLPPAVLLDGDDGPEIKKGLFHRFRFGLYFKREYHLYGETGIKDKYAKWRTYGANRSLFERTFPLPFSVILESIPSVNDLTKEIDISFSGKVSHRKRIQAVQLLQSTPDLRFEGGVFAEPNTRKSKIALGTISIWAAKIRGDPYVTEAEWRTKLDLSDYFRLLGRSKIGLSLRGGGFDSMRYWEIVASKTLLLSEKPTIYIPNNFEDGKHAVFCRPDLSDLLDLVRSYIRDEARRKEIAQAGYKHLLKYHTCEQRAMQFLKVCRERL